MPNCSLPSVHLAFSPPGGTLLQSSRHRTPSREPHRCSAPQAPAHDNMTLLLVGYRDECTVSEHVSQALLLKCLPSNCSCKTARCYATATTAAAAAAAAAAATATAAPPPALATATAHAAAAAAAPPPPPPPATATAACCCCCCCSCCCYCHCYCCCSCCCHLFCCYSCYYDDDYLLIASTSAPIAATSDLWPRHYEKLKDRTSCADRLPVSFRFSCAFSESSRGGGASCEILLQRQGLRDAFRLAYFGCLQLVPFCA